jgi:glucose/arabinose dehydrogenase
MRVPRRVLPLALLAALGACGASADDSTTPAATTAATTAPAPPARSARVHLVRIGTFDSPLYVTAPRGDRRRVFVVEQTGRIRVVVSGRTLAAPFLDLRSRISCCGERGLLSMAFAPDFASSRRFYVDYTDTAGNTRVVEYRAGRSHPNRAIVGSARLVLRQDQPEPNHNGGLVTFGPDGLLYIGLGDGGGGDDQHGRRGNGQNLSTLLGKILRIDPRRRGGRRYTVPRSNPFVRRRGARGEIYSYGLRNPWRFSFDRRTGDLAIGDVGQNRFEEIDFVRRGRGRGANFGWRPFEGNSVHSPGERAPGHVRPVLTYGTGVNGTCAVVGGYLVRDPGLAALRGRYLYSDNCQGTLRSAVLRPGSARARRSLGLRVQGMSSFGEDGVGRVYATSLSGPVFRLAG